MKISIFSFDLSNPVLTDNLSWTTFIVGQSRCRWTQVSLYLELSHSRSTLLSPFKNIKICYSGQSILNMRCRYGLQCLHYFQLNKQNRNKITFAKREQFVVDFISLYHLPMHGFFFRVLTDRQLVVNRKHP